MEKKICPKCETDKITLVTGGLSGKWECLGCGYTNDVFPEIMGANTKKKK